MNFERWMDLGYRWMGSPTALGAARSIVDRIPGRALAGVGLSRPTTMSVAAPLVSAFVIGAAAGAGAAIFFAPGNEQMRRDLQARVGAARDRIRDRAQEVEAELFAAREETARAANGARDADGLDFVRHDRA